MFILSVSRNMSERGVGVKVELLLASNTCKELGRAATGLGDDALPTIIPLRGSSGIGFKIDLKGIFGDVGEQNIIFSALLCGGGESGLSGNTSETGELSEDEL